MKACLLLSLLALSAEAASPKLKNSLFSHARCASSASLLGDAPCSPFRLISTPEAVSLPLADKLHLLDGARSVPLDDGGGAGISASDRPILALVLGLLVGFGLGHLVAKDRSGFVLFLIIDLAIIVVSTVFFWGPWIHGGWGFGFLFLFISHVIQGLDAWGKAGGERIIQLTRESEVRFAYRGNDPLGPVSTTRLFRWAF